MPEAWFEKAREGSHGQGLEPFRWIRIFTPGIWIIFAVIALVGGRLYWEDANRPSHRQEITAAFGLVSLFYGAPQMNHDGSQFIYVATDAKGYALFLCDAATGRKQIVCEENSLGALGDSFDLHAWPWSPDDGAFIYSAQDKLFICQPVNIKESKPVAIGANGISNLVWINPLEFVWSKKEVIYDAKLMEGQWEIHKLPQKGEVLSLTAIDDHTIAWLQQNYICRLSLAKDLFSTNNSFGSNPLQTMGEQHANLGLRIYAGSVISPYDRQELTTVDQNQSWVDGNYPVVYSFTLLHAANYNGFQTHIFLLPVNHAGKSMSNNGYIDYQASNELWLQINGSINGQVTANISWKTNLPNANPNNLAINITNSTAVGTWTVTFNSAADGTLTAPGAVPVPFTIADSNVAADFANPLVAFFGLQPQSTNAYGAFEDYANITINGVSGSQIDDNFTTDTSIGPNWNITAASGCTVLVSSNSSVTDKHMPLSSNLILWFDASALQQANQTPVTKLEDLSFRNNTAIANRNPPSYNAPGSVGSLNRKGIIHFESGNSIMNATGLKTVRPLDISGSQPRTVFAVMRRNGMQMSISSGEAEATGAYFGICDQKDGIYLPGGWGFDDNIVPPSSADWNILEVVYDGTSQKGYINGVLKGTTTFLLDTVDKELEIGLRTGKNEAGSDGDFAELLVYNRVLDSNERQQVENYLSEKWFGTKLLSPGNPLVWCDPQLEGITSFSCSKKTGQLLLNSTARAQESLWLFDPALTKPDNLSQIAEANSIYDQQWIGINECAYASRTSAHNGIILADSSGSEKGRLFEHGNINAFVVSPDSGKLLILGTISNEPSMGIWQYDLVSSKLKSVVSYSEHPSIYAENIEPTQGTVELSSGRNVTYTIYPPAHFNWHKKYPLVIGDTMSYVAINGDHGRLWVPGIATCGAFVVIVNRYGWWNGIEQWEENVMAVYQNMVHNPSIDDRQVFLFGASAETQYMSECLARSPGLWKGAIFLNPTKLPDFSELPPFQQRPKILISAGELEGEDARFKQYQENALQSGVMADVVIAPGEAHHFVGNTAQLQRTRAIMHFIFEE